MRIGLLGPSQGEREALREAIEFLLGDVEVDQAIYLGDDDDLIDSVLTDWVRELFGDEPCEEAFLREAAALAEKGTAEDIRALLEREAWVRKFARVRKLPPPPARAIEMLGDRILLAVHDKKILDEEDVANAQLIVYGKSKEAALRRFGPRYFLTPGPLSLHHVAVLEVEEEGGVSIALFETSGLPVWRETMARRTHKVHVVQ